MKLLWLTYPGSPSLTSEALRIELACKNNKHLLVQFSNSGLTENFWKQLQKLYHAFSTSTKEGSCQHLFAGLTLSFWKKICAWVGGAFCCKAQNLCTVPSCIHVYTVTVPKSLHPRNKKAAITRVGGFPQVSLQ